MLILIGFRSRGLLSVIKADRNNYNLGRQIQLDFGIALLHNLTEHQHQIRSIHNQDESSQNQDDFMIVSAHRQNVKIIQTPQKFLLNYHPFLISTNYYCFHILLIATLSSNLIFHIRFVKIDIHEKHQ